MKERERKKERERERKKERERDLHKRTVTIYNIMVHLSAHGWLCEVEVLYSSTGRKTLHEQHRKNMG